MIQLGAIALLLTIVTPVHAGWWCARGPGQQPDHPCDDDWAPGDAAAAKYRTQWMAQYRGISEVRRGFDDDGDYTELLVTVDPPELASSVEAVLPNEADGFPVRVIPRQDFDGDYAEGSEDPIADDAATEDEIAARARLELMREVLSEDEIKIVAAVAGCDYDRSM